MKILVVGSGGREHAIVWKISQSTYVKKIYAAPGNAGISELAECIDIKVTEFNRLIDFVRTETVDLTVIGPELPLACGIVDAFEKEQLHIFGPTQRAAEIESSKVFAKQLMRKYQIPTAEFRIFTNPDDAVKYLHHTDLPVVIKADGLAAGKGAIIAKDINSAIDTINLMLVKKAFGDAGKRIIIEQFLEGEEFSILAFTDGDTVLPMVSAQDYKRVFDNDRGANTGGMGSYAPTPQLSDQTIEQIRTKILIPIINALSNEARTYRGIIYAGLILTDDGPKVLEFNCRFGDPETQVILPLLQTDIVEIFQSVCENRLAATAIEWNNEKAICVVLASGGYPGTYETGKQISGLDYIVNRQKIVVFHAGTKKQNDKIFTAGGRVLGITGYGDNFREVYDNVYEAVSQIYFDNMHYRKDIGMRVLEL